MAEQLEIASGSHQVWESRSFEAERKVIYDIPL